MKELFTQFLTVILAVLILQVSGQKIQIKKLEIQAYKPTNAYLLESYLTPDGRYSVILNPGTIHVIDNQTGEVSVSQKLLTKSIESIEQNGDPMAFVQEGTAFMALPSLNKLVILDWNLRTQKVMTVDFDEGKVIWQSEAFKYVNSKGEIAEKMVADKVIAGFAKKTNATVTSESQRLIQQNFLTTENKPFFSKNASSFITPVLQEKGFLIKVENGQQMVDLETGEARWTFNEFPLVVGSYIELPERGEVVLFNDNKSAIGKNSSRQTAVILNTKTGVERLRFEPEGLINSDGIKVLNDLLIFDYVGFSAVDLNSGNFVLKTLESPVAKTEAGRFFSSQATTGNTPPLVAGLNSLIDDQKVYTGYIKGSLGNTPASQSFGTKNTIAKYDLQSGEQLWESKDLADAIYSLAFVKDKRLYIQRNGFSKQEWIVMDTETGKVLDRIEQDKGPNCWSETGVFHAGKKSIRFYQYSNLAKPQITIEYKSLKVGKLERLILYHKGVFCVGKEGVAWLDKKGSLVKEHSVTKPLGSFMNASYAFIITKKANYVIDVDGMSQIGSLPFEFNRREDMVLLAPEADQFITIENRKNIQIAHVEK